MPDASGGRWPRVSHAFCAGAVLLICASLASAAAEVRLSTYVHKVETTTGPSGARERRMVEADAVLPGDELRYTITFTNVGDETVEAGTIVITNPLPEDTEYLPGSAAGEDTEISFSSDGESFAPTEAALAGTAEPDSPAEDRPTIRWLYQNALDPGESSSVSFDLRLLPKR